MSPDHDKALSPKAGNLLAAACGTCVALLAAGGALAATPAFPLDPHRAVYDLTLESRESSAGVTSVRGRMVHEFSGDICDGYSISMRWVAQMGDSDGGVTVDDLRFASWEDGEGDSYTYTSTRFLNDRMVEEVKAHAERDDNSGEGVISLTKPEEAEIVLPAGTIFPTAHLRAVLEAAVAGRTFTEESVYDVSESGRQIYNTLAVVGARGEGAGAVDVEAIPAAARLKDIPAWRVTVSYFKGDAAGEETPAFEQSFDLLANGVATSLMLNYGEIVIKGTLKDLEFLTAEPCAAPEKPE